ncbi:MAG: hypothetical protein JWN61_3073 [Pseudonocardiales bacterium]|nr:hypothetical protein [Jatrophihabitantaceae bacterium]MCW2604938.1 hypothetical protein [Pseudonocardiales bacterium]
MTESMSDRSDTSDGGFGDSVYEAGDPDAEYLDPAETLTGDGTPESLDEPLDTSYSPPDFQPVATRYGTTDLEQALGESLDQRLAQEEPDISPDDISFDDEDPRAGRLVAPDEGAHEDREKDEIAFDAGRAGYAASAEEAAMHIVSDTEIEGR